MKTVKKAILGLALLGLLWVARVRMFGSHDDAFTDEGLLTANASDLKHTIVTSHFETPLASEKNVLWCGTFQLAWNEACTLVGEDLHLSNEPAMVGILNKRAFTKQDLDAESYVAVAGFVKDDVHGQIVQQLEDTFVGQARPRYIPPRSLTPRPQDIVVYSYLFKNLEFETPFERISKPVAFGTEQVSCFGIGEEYKDKHHETHDRVILAKAQPEPTLETTVQAVQKRAANPKPTQPQVGDVLKVPKFNFDITRRYREVERKKLLTKNLNVANDLVVLSALQNVRFQFDEKGVRLRSESHIAIGCGMSAPPPPTRHIMIFDKPFLVMLQRSEADVPYFALWVGNPELLVKIKT